MGCGASTAQVPPRQLVLLGGGECGKTTIFKQIQLLHGSGFSDEVRSDWVSAVSASPLRSMRVLLTKADELGLPVNEVNATAATRRRTGGWLQRWAVTVLGAAPSTTALGPPPRSAADGAPSSPQAFKEAILGSYQSLNQLTEEAAGRIKEVYKSPEIQNLINDKEQKLDLDDNAF